MTVFRVTPADDPAARILLEQYAAWRAAAFEKQGLAYRIAPARPEELTGERGVFLVAEGENLAGEAADVGCAGIRMLADGPAGRRAELKHLWVQPHARGSGLGAELVRELMRRARDDFGAQELVLDSHDSLASAAALYRALGFRPVEPYNDNPNANVWLARRLDESATTG
ncbi:GNAT family N-acetyltransferase [Microcella sp.]|uniref:GNAT family N-acetyltransferase n=1 Tax=Microcella sp. TaxID=1913979 RepID=UPI00391C0606